MHYAFVKYLVLIILRFLDDPRGASATMVAVILPALIGFVALGVETGMWYTIKVQNQSAADAGAISAAYQIIAGKTDIIGDLIPAASEAAAQNGYKGTIPAIVYPYADDIVSNGIAVTLHQTQPALFSALFLSDIIITTRAVGTIKLADNPCILALGTTSTDVEISAGTTLAMPNCAIAANSISRNAVALNSTASSLAASTIVTAGELVLQGTPVNPAALPSQFSLVSPPRIGAPAVTDPYANTLTHAFLTTGMAAANNCTPTIRGASTTYQAGNCVIPSGLEISIGQNQTIDLAPGTYWINGDLTIPPTGSLKGYGVTIVLAGRASILGATFTLNAPSSGALAGVVIVQDVGEISPSRGSQISGGPGATLNGLVYFPKSPMTFHGNPSVTGPKCLLLVVKWLNVDADSTLDSSGCANIGLANLPTLHNPILAE
jgi:Flp pilus assembly protein TadG